MISTVAETLSSIAPKPAPPTKGETWLEAWSP
jgi:hypothetical protein